MLNDKIINIITLDSKIEIDKDLISNYIRDCNLFEEEECIKIEVTTKILNYVIEYLTYFKRSGESEPNLPELIDEFPLEDIVKNKYCIEFLNKLELEEIIEVINISKILKLDNLHDLVCTKVSCLLREESADEIKSNLFTIECILEEDNFMSDNISKNILDFESDSY